MGRMINYKFMAFFIAFVVYLNSAATIKAQEVVSIPYDENFNMEDSMDDWTVLNIDGDSYTWSYGTQNIMCRTLKTEGATPQDWFVSPRVNITSDLFLGFTYTTMLPVDGKDVKFSVYIIEDSPENYANAIEIIPTITITRDEESGEYIETEVCISLNEYAGMDGVYIAFKNESDAGASYIILDNFIISPKTYITAQLCEYGGIYPEGITAIYSGYGITYNIVAAYDYKIDAVYVDGVDVTDKLKGNTYRDATYEFKSVTENTSIYAEFSRASAVTLPYYTVWKEEDAEKWVIIDGNNDGITWSVNPDDFSATFDGSQTTTSSYDWLISPRITLSEEYIAKLNIGSYPAMDASSVSANSFGVYLIADTISNYMNAEKLSVVDFSGNFYEGFKWEYALANYIGKEVYLAFRETSSAGSGSCRVSDISIFNLYPTSLTIDDYILDVSSEPVCVYGTLTLKDVGKMVTLSPVYVDDLFIYADITRLGTPEIIQLGWSTSSMQAKKSTIIRSIDSSVNDFISLPFDYDIANIKVDNNDAIFGENIKIYVYDGEKRAAGSYDGFTATGWTEITSGVIPANQGFAFAVNADNGDTQSVSFPVDTTITYTGDYIDIPLNIYESTANNGVEASWNLFGNPHLGRVSKGTGYTMYTFVASSNSYSEYSSVEDTYINPFTAVFTQAGENFTGLTFEPTTYYSSVYSSTDFINAQASLTINGDEDEAKIFVVDGTSSEYVVNEDAMYLNSGASKVAQIYYIDQNGMSIASTVVPELYDSVTVAYQAVTSGTQSIAMTTDIYTTPIYLYDNVTEQSTLMIDGMIYEFESTAGTFTNRFTLITEGEAAGITTPTTSTTSNIKVITASNAITICGAEIGSPISITTTNGTTIYNGTITTTNHRININTPSGVLVVKVCNEVVKIVIKN